METKKDYINRLLNEARMRGLCKTQKEFAALLGMNPSTITNALKGNEKYLTDSILRRWYTRNCLQDRPLRVFHFQVPAIFGQHQDKNGEKGKGPAPPQVLTQTLSIYRK